jgi:FkbM family methyltransferase
MITLKKDYYTTYKNKLHLSRKNYNYLKTFHKTHYQSTTISFNKRQLTFNNPFWFLHSLDEIFVEEVYKIDFLKKKPVIIDCGANIGLSVLYFKMIFPQASIIAFEADTNIYKQLEANIAPYNFNDVSLINAAVWNSETELAFASEGSVGGKIDFSKDKSMDNVKAIRLKNYLNIEIDLLKIDIEGAEYEVIKDCANDLMNVKNLFIEYHDFKGEKQNLHEILTWLAKAGFTYYIKEAWNNMTHPFLKKYNDFFNMQLNIFCFR